MDICSNTITDRIQMPLQQQNEFVDNIQTIVNTIHNRTEEYNLDNYRPQYNDIPYSFRSLLEHLDIMNKVYNNSINELSEYDNQPTNIKVQLRPHQLSMLYAMKEKEKTMINGMP
jgi:hypothetical protein